MSGYDYGAVIAYHTARTPGLGSGIFLHVNIGIATAGCVILPMGELLRVLRWLDPARSPRNDLNCDRRAPDRRGSRWGPASAPGRDRAVASGQIHQRGR